MSENRVERDGTRAVVFISGDLVASSVPELRSTMQALLADGVRNLSVDLASVTRIDSMGIGLLVGAYNSLARAGGVFGVTGASKDFRELFASLGLEERFRTQA